MPVRDKFVIVHPELAEGDDPDDINENYFIPSTYNLGRSGILG